MISRLPKLACCSLLVAILAGCAVPPPARYNYAKFRAESPKSVLVVPAVNKSVEVDAPDYLLSSISIPLVERGYYVFPVHLVKQVMSDDGMSDADMVHNNDPVRLATVFGADSVMYISINRWDAQYAVFSTVVTVELAYTLKSGKSGETLWAHKEKLAYSPDNNSGGHPLAMLIAAAITAAIAKAAPDYMPLARQANNGAIYKLGTGLPAGPYDESFNKDLAAY